jgi:FkbM family methyltransferase
MRPPLHMRSAAAAFRVVPPLRGRGRVEMLLHRMLLDRHLTDVVTVNGYDVEVSLDDLIGRSIYLNGVWEPNSTAAIRELVRPGMTVFDVGANTGYYALLFSKLTGASGKVHAFEPVPSTLAVLRRNLARNQASNVDVIDVALSDHEGEVAINVATERNLGASHVVAEDAHDRGREYAGVADTIRIRCRTTDAVWRELGRPAVDLVKIDIEGHELHAIRGMTEMLSSSPNVTVLVEVRDTFLKAAGGSGDELFGLLANAGLHSYDFDFKTRGFRRNDATRSGELVVFSKRALA